MIAIARQLVAFRDWMVEGVCEGLRRLTDGLNGQPAWTPWRLYATLAAGGTLLLFWWLVALLVLYLNGGPFGG